MVSDFLNTNSRAIQEHFKNISILFKCISDIENITTIDLKFLKKKKMKYKYQQIQMKYKYQQEQNYESLSIIKYLSKWIKESWKIWVKFFMKLEKYN